MYVRANPFSRIRSKGNITFFNDDQFTEMQSIPKNKKSNDLFSRTCRQKKLAFYFITSIFASHVQSKGKKRQSFVGRLIKKSYTTNRHKILQTERLNFKVERFHRNIALGYKQFMKNPNHRVCAMITSDNQMSRGLDYRATSTLLAISSTRY